jgi:hypothetical protein
LECNGAAISSIYHTRESENGKASEEDGGIGSVDVCVGVCVCVCVYVLCTCCVCGYCLRFCVGTHDLPQGGVDRHLHIAVRYHEHVRAITSIGRQTASTTCMCWVIWSWVDRCHIYMSGAKANEGPSRARGMLLLLYCNARTLNDLLIIQSPTFSGR